MEIHVTRDGAKHGPYGIDEARSLMAAGQLLESDLAWHEGLTDWTTLCELLNATAAAPGPALPPMPAPAPAAGADKTITPGRIVLGVVLVLVIVVVGLDHLARSKFQSAQEFLDELSQSVPADHLTKEFGRDPVSSENKGGRVVDRYVWNGPLRVYIIHVTYSKNSATDTMFVEETNPKMKWRFAGGDDDDDSVGSSGGKGKSGDLDDFEFGEPTLPPGGPGGPVLPPSLPPGG